MQHSAFLDSRVQFVAAAAAWSVGLLAVVRSAAGERLLVAPFTAANAFVAALGAGGSPVHVDTSCSGSDVLAIALAIILAYPVPWRARLTGLAGAVLWLTALNLLRIITLFHAAGTAWFLPLHLYVWPGLLIAAAVAFVATWIWIADSRNARRTADFARWRRFALAATILVIGYVAAAPVLLQSMTLYRAAWALALGAAATLRALGLDALAGGSTLIVGPNSYLVTPECLVTPLMPVYLAWAVSWPRALRGKTAALLLFVPLFVTLGFLRLLTVAMPALIGPPLFLTHGFYQFVVGAAITAAAVWHRVTHGGGRRHLGYAIAAGALALLLARPYTALLAAWSAAILRAAPDPLSADLQGAAAILPPYQLALLWALLGAWFAGALWRPLVWMTTLTVLSHVAIAALPVSTMAGVPAVFVRGWSVALPILLLGIAIVARREHRHHAVLAGAHP